MRKNLGISPRDPNAPDARVIELTIDKFLDGDADESGTNEAVSHEERPLVPEEAVTATLLEEYTKAAGSGEDDFSGLVRVGKKFPITKGLLDGVNEAVKTLVNVESSLWELNAAIFAMARTVEILSA